MIEILFVLLFMVIMFIIAEFGATVLISFIDFSSDSDEEDSDEKKDIIHDGFFVRVKRPMHSSYESEYDSFYFETLKEAEDFKRYLIEDGVPEERTKIERK